MEDLINYNKENKQYLSEEKLLNKQETNEKNDVIVLGERLDENTKEYYNAEYNYDIDTELNQIEITDDLVNQILADKERHIDVLNRPANYEQALVHLKASQYYDKEKMKKDDKSKEFNNLYKLNCRNIITYY